MRRTSSMEIVSYVEKRDIESVSVPRRQWSIKTTKTTGRR
jgi:hypothetical protein